MKRAGGVTASGVIGILGSVLTILFAMVLAGTSVAIRSRSLPAGAATPPFDVSKVLIVESIVLFGLAIFGIVCSIELLKLRNWARISFVVFAGVLAGSSIMSIFGMSVSFFLMPQIGPPPGQGPPPQAIIIGVFLVFALIALALLGLSVWWLYYFTRRSVKEQFLTEVELETPRRGPLSVTIIAWFLVIGGCLGCLALVVSYPIFLFGFVFKGWTAKLVLVLLSIASLTAGVGMLRWRPQAHTLALALYGFFLLSALGSLLPGSMARMQDAVREMAYPAPNDLPAFNQTPLWMGMLLGIIAVCVPLWFLVTRRRAFLDACRAE
jgi:hypothetical protein